ncbi:hypothetical protein DOTSEDRAFT_37326 [Dothistroma septosporum NZE10]|uniref:Uncharacterized protein n=1 Tax=Dothistroma septosporum (strain NZE10 / CBS 128990) TaxID=675120 RepID=N1PEG6_DOTSN|nr:hypothetical protein DOTSEDRAFT_37326 [Dothistroma septosporum NZE10]
MHGLHPQPNPISILPASTTPPPAFPPRYNLQLTKSSAASVSGAASNKNALASKRVEDFVHPPFIAKSQTNNAYAQPNAIYVVQHLIEEYTGPGPNFDLEGAKKYPIAIRSFMDKGLAESFAKTFSFERARMLGLGQSEWGQESRGKELQSCSWDTVGWGWKICTRDGIRKETV